MPVTHTTAADASFSPAGKRAWDASHTLGANLTFLDSMASADAAGLRTLAGLEWLGSYTWANLPSASSNSGKTATVTDLGSSPGTIVRSDGSRWAPQGGVATLKHLGAAVTGVTNSEAIVMQALLPAGAWQANDIIRFYVDLTKSGTTDSLVYSVHVGTAGTIADTYVVNTTLLGAANQSGGFVFDFKLVSATSVKKVGGPNSISTYGVSNSAAAAAVAISSASANALYASFSINSSGTTNTVGIDAGRIELLTQ